MDPLTKSEYAFSKLRDAVIAGVLKPGDWVRAEEWAEKLSLSETPVREALGRLEGLGLVEMYPHRGARVKARTREHVIETYLMRTALEVLAAQQAVERASDSVFSALVKKVESLTTKMDAALVREDMDDVRELNREIHMTIYEGAGFPRLLALIKSLWATYPFDTLSLLRGRPGIALNEHKHILKALKTRDPAAMAEAMQAHLKSAQHLLMEVEVPGFEDVPQEDSA